MNRARSQGYLNAIGVKRWVLRHPPVLQSAPVVNMVAASSSFPPAPLIIKIPEPSGIEMKPSLAIMANDVAPSITAPAPQLTPKVKLPPTITMPPPQQLDQCAAHAPASIKTAATQQMLLTPDDSMAMPPSYSTIEAVGDKGSLLLPINVAPPAELTDVNSIESTAPLEWTAPPVVPEPIQVITDDLLPESIEPITPDLPAAIAVPIQQMNWEQLAATVANCQLCELCHERNKTVFGYGNQNATLLLVGEAPGRDEDAQGEPFVGRAGQLLTRMLAAMSLRRDQVYICNIIKCRPPQNRDPLPAEIAHCRAYLERQIALIAPKVILCLGRVAAQTLLETNETVGKLRGRWYEYSPLAVPLRVTYHPSYYLRAPREKARGWEDLQELMRQLRRISI